MTKTIDIIDDHSAVAADKKPRKPKVASMTLKQRFDLQQFVSLASGADPDATVAKQASEAFGRPVLTATVSAYRKAFGQKTVARPSRAQLEIYIDQLISALKEHAPSVAVPEMMIDA